MSSAANNAIYAGLKFTGLALTVASDLAKSVRKDLLDAQEKEARVSVPVFPVLCSAVHLMRHRGEHSLQAYSLSQLTQCQ